MNCGVEGKENRQYISWLIRLILQLDLDQDQTDFYFSHMRRSSSLKQTIILGKVEGEEGTEDQHQEFWIQGQKLCKYSLDFCGNAWTH